VTRLKNKQTKRFQKWVKRDRPGEYRPNSHYQQQSYRGRSFFPRPTVNMTTEFEVSVIDSFPCVAGSKCVCVWGGGGGRAEGGAGKEIKANGKFLYQYPMLTSCEQLAPRAKSDV